MNTNIHSRVTESVGANNISCILKNNNDFSVTGYKVMQNHSFSGLVRCAKLMYNGKIKLVYLIDDKKPLSLVVSRLGISELSTVITNLLQKVIDIKTNGFFLAENLELNYDKIFVDTTDNSVYFLYYPLAAFDTGKMMSFETNVRAAFVKLFADFSVFNTPHFAQLVNDITKTDLPIDVVMRNFKANIKGQPNGKYQDFSSNHIYNAKDLDKTNNMIANRNEKIKSANNRSHRVQPALTLKSTASSFQMVVSRPDFIVGKNPSVVHGLISDNPAISRVHCRITYNEGNYYIQDEGSSNGTFLNETRLKKSEKAELKNGDTVRIANSKFVISF